MIHPYRDLKQSSVRIIIINRSKYLLSLLCSSIPSLELCFGLNRSMHVFRERSLRSSSVPVSVANRKPVKHRLLYERFTFQPRGTVRFLVSRVTHNVSYFLEFLLNSVRNGKLLDTTEFWRNKRFWSRRNVRNVKFQDLFVWIKKEWSDYLKEFLLKLNITAVSRRSTWFIHSLTVYYIYFPLIYSDSKKYLQNFETFFYHFIFIVSNFCSYMKTLNDTNFQFNVIETD